MWFNFETPLHHPSLSSSILVGNESHLSEEFKKAFLSVDLIWESLENSIYFHFRHSLNENELICLINGGITAFSISRRAKIRTSNYSLFSSDLEMMKLLS